MDYSKLAAAAIKAVFEGMRDMSAKERRIIELRYGIVNGTCYTLEEVGKEFGVTRERIRQIEAKALERVRVKLSATYKIALEHGSEQK